MRRALALLSFVVACSGSTAKVDPSLVGSWELMVPNAQGVARWVWDIRADGTYGFHAEGPGNIPAHSGVFEARGGHYILRSTTLAWIDTGTYVPPHGDTLTATGKLGTASWVRAKAAQGPARSDSTSVPAETRAPIRRPRSTISFRSTRSTTGYSKHRRDSLAPRQSIRTRESEAMA